MLASSTGGDRFIAPAAMMRGRGYGSLGAKMGRRTLRKLLVANRGEIALRIIRSARLMGIATVAVFSEADRESAHLAAADEAFSIGPAEAQHSYLNIGAILEAADRTGADAIHPGYGFLSERPEFARAVEDHGLIFVGPPAGVMELLGDKAAARRLAVASGIPVIPGIESGDPAAVQGLGAASGFPLVVKAAAGGGGRGMRLVREASEIQPALEAATREAHTAFGDGRLLVERYLEEPRHVEVQLMGDGRGKVIALGDRDCSIQRRYQKLLEESPAPGLSEGLRQQLTDAALRLASRARYRSAGTAEFLVAGDRFYFLEVNARLQVEHPVTEMRYGCDLVGEQLRVAQGDALSEVPMPRGCAIECRVNAEEPEHDFRPATGEVLYLHLPAGPNVRVDTSLQPGAVVSAHYDGLLAKVVCFGLTREEARMRMISALGEFTLAGVPHTAALMRDIVASEPFSEVRLSTRFIQRWFRDWQPDADTVRAALVAAALLTGRDRAMPSAAGGSSRRADGDRSPWTRLGHFELWSRQ